MVFTQGRGFVAGTSFGLQHPSLRSRVLICNAADTASLATWFLFGKLIDVATLFDFGEKRCRKNLPLCDLPQPMVDITHSLLDDQELRAHFAPAMSSRHKPWFITLTRGGELVNSAEPLEHRPTVLLGDDDVQPLHDALIALDIDYMPSSTADGAEHRTLTYRVGSQIRHIMLVGGVSSDFSRRSQFNTVWKLLDKLAQKVARKRG